MIWGSGKTNSLNKRSENKRIKVAFVMYSSLFIKTHTQKYIYNVINTDTILIENPQHGHPRMYTRVCIFYGKSFLTNSNNYFNKLT